MNIIISNKLANCMLKELNKCMVLQNETNLLGMLFQLPSNVEVINLAWSICKLRSKIIIIVITTSFKC